MVPSLGSFFTPLKLVDAFLEYDEFFALSRRKYVPPNFAEMRHVLNIAQVHLSRCWPPAWTPLCYGQTKSLQEPQRLALFLDAADRQPKERVDHLLC